MKPIHPRLERGHPLAKELLGSWFMTEGVGTKAFDSSGFANHGMFSGTVTWAQDIDGPILDFDPAADSKIPIAITSNVSSRKPILRPSQRFRPMLPVTFETFTTSIFFNTETITVVAIVYTDSTTALRTAVSRWDVKNRVFLLGQGAATSSFRFAVYLDNVFWAAESTTGFATGTRKVLVGTFDGNFVRLYVDNVLTAETPVSGAVRAIDSDPVGLVIGGRASATDSWDGRIGSVAILGRAISYGEVLRFGVDPYALIKRTRFYPLIPSNSIAGHLNVAIRNKIAAPLTSSGPATGFLNVAVRTKSAQKPTGFFKQPNVVLAFQDTYQLLSAEMDSKGAAVTFQAGELNLFRIKIPKNHWTESRCGHVYKSLHGCHYGSDEFEGSSEINFKLLGDGPSGIQGWCALNTESADVQLANSNVTNPGFLTLKISPTIDLGWSVTRKNAPFVYRKFDAVDFDFEAKVAGDGNEDEESEGIFVTNDSDVPTQWVHLRRQWRLGVNNIIASKLEGGTEIEVFSLPASFPYLRVQRTTTDVDEDTTVFKVAFYAKAVDTDPWSLLIEVNTQQDTFTSGKIRVGLTAASNRTLRGTAFTSKFEYIRMLAGGLPSCTNVLTGANGCEDHENTRRFDGAPSILKGPIIL